MWSGCFPNYCLCIGPWGKWVCALVSQFAAAPGPLVFKASCFRARVSGTTGLKSWSIWRGVKIFSSSGRSSAFVRSLLIVGHCTRGGDFGKTPIPVSYPSQCESFLFEWTAALQLAFSSFSDGIVSYVAVDSMYMWEPVSSESSYVMIWNCSP